MDQRRDDMHAPDLWAPTLQPAMPSLESPGAQWLASVMNPPSAALADWADSPDHLAEIPLGLRFDVLRVSEGLAVPVLDDLANSDVTLGPVLHCQRRRCLEFLVPVGTAASWAPLRGTVCAGRGGALCCPAPGATSRGRTWLYPPLGTGVLTDPGLLRARLEPLTMRGYRL
ncbi:hypothetical protein ACF068_14450 [Streptomyces sp. NPDC016309]|uniref:hypothetical protein n=1 Tax=Streptomyces sp. NPDC016309 TaxID=3364965 RepID=UPI0036F8DF67